MNTSENIRMLGRTVEAARNTQIRKLAEVEAETQADIDEFHGRFMETTLDTVKRYHQFKLDLWNSGERIASDPMCHVTRVNPDALEFESVYEEGNKLVFTDTSQEYSGSFFVVPLAYFNDPEQWEKELLVWIENINAMITNAPDILSPDYTYSAATVMLPYPGDFFYLRQKKEGKTIKTYNVEYHTGNIYLGSVEEIEAGLVEPVGCLG